jgi:antitoxin CptB
MLDHPSSSRLRWQCRRGMRELDVLLSRYLEREYPQAAEMEQRAFERLLQLSDPELMSYLLIGHDPEDPELARVVQRLRTVQL